jgi:hypothetical protein
MDAPSEVFHLPVIGTVTMNNIVTPGTTDYEVILEQEKFYVANQWYKEYKKIPQLLPKDFVVKFVRKAKNRAERIVHRAMTQSYRISTVQGTPWTNENLAVWEAKLKSLGVNYHIDNSIIANLNGEQIYTLQKQMKHLPQKLLLTRL